MGAKPNGHERNHEAEPFLKPQAQGHQDQKKRSQAENRRDLVRTKSAAGREVGA